MVAEDQSVELIGFNAESQVLPPVALRTEPYRVTMVEDGVILPTKRVAPGHLYSFNGGVVTRDGTPVISANQTRSGGVTTFGTLEPVAVRQPAQLDEEIIFLGWSMHHHYGHFLLESLSRCWYALAARPSLRVAFLPHTPNPLTGVPRRMLELLGIPADRVLFVRVPTRFSRVHVPDQLYEHLGIAHVGARAVYQRIAERVMDGVEPAVSDQPVYLSRAAVAHPIRAIREESELEAIVRDRGYHVAFPDRMSFDEQVLLFNAHTDYVGCGGSALHSVLFSRQHPRIHQFDDRIPFADFQVGPALAGASVTVLKCLEKTDKGVTQLTLDVPRAIAYLDQVIPAPAGLGAAGYQRAMEPEPGPVPELELTRGARADKAAVAQGLDPGEAGV